MNKQSTFLSSPMVPSVIAKQAASYQPNLSRDGSMVLDALAMSKERASISQIRAVRRAKYETVFTSDEAAIEYVKAMVLRYSE